MGMCAFSDGSALFDATPVENLFIQEYMPSAPGHCLRVYLYGLMICHHPEMGSSIEDMAKTLRMEPDAIQKAYTYWERLGLVERISDNPPMYHFMSPRHALANVPDPEDAAYQYRDFTNELQLLFGTELLHPQDYTMVMEWVDDLRLPPEVVLEMTRAEIARGDGRRRTVKTILKKVNMTALEWKDQGIDTVEAARRRIEQDNTVERCVRPLLKRLGLNRKATDDELDLASKWINEWRFSPDEILSACAETVKGRNPSFGYLDSILSAHRSGQGTLVTRIETENRTDEFLRSLLNHLGKRGASPTPDQRARYAEYRAAGFTDDVIEAAAKLCGEKARADFTDLTHRLKKWGELGLTTLEAVQSYREKQNALTTMCYAIFAQCGLDKKPGLSDIQYAEKWRALASDELIAFAAACAHGKAYPMKYMDTLLVGWNGADIHTVEAARQEYDGRTGTPASHTHRPRANVPAFNYEQRVITSHDFDNRFFVNLDDDDEEGERR